MTVGIPQMKTFVFVKNLCDLTDENLLFNKIAEQRQSMWLEIHRRIDMAYIEPEFTTKVW